MSKASVNRITLTSLFPAPILTVRKRPYVWRVVDVRAWESAHGLGLMKKRKGR